MDSTLISLQHVTIRYPGKTAFSDISFELKENEHWAFINKGSLLPNALIDALAGNAIISGGVVSFNFFQKYIAEKHLDKSTMSPHYLMAFLSLQHHFKSISGVNNFYYQQRYNSQDAENSVTVHDYLSAIKSFSKQRYGSFGEIMKTLRLEHLEDRPVIQLSNGETRRVLIAAALLRHPLILLMDHPFTGLDVQSRAELKHMINKISKLASSIVMSTSVNEIPDCITHVAVFNKENQIEIFKKEAFNIGENGSFKKVNEQAIKSILKNNFPTHFETMVDMKNVTVKYNEKIILDNINWTIRQGERWSLSGPNGSGKTTLLSLINGDNPQAFANDIILFDRKKGSGESIWDIKKKVGFFSPEMYQYFPLETSCLHAVESGFYDTIGLFRPSDSSLAYIAYRWMEILEIPHLSEKLLIKVNQDEQRKCLLARALVKNPPLLIFDEPCQGLNESDQLFVKNLLETICRMSHVTMIYVSHYEDEIPNCVDHFFRLKKGKKLV